MAAASARDDVGASHGVGDNRLGWDRTQRVRNYTLERCEKLLSSSVIHTPTNIHGKLYARCAPLQPLSMERTRAPHDDDGLRPSFAAVIGGGKAAWTATRIGDHFGPSWATHWLRVTLPRPSAEWLAAGGVLQNEGEVHLVFDSGSEAMLYTAQGEALQAFTGGHGCDRRAEYIVPLSWWATASSSSSSDDGDAASAIVVVYIEVACNGMFGMPADGDMISAPVPDRFFTLDSCHLAVYDLVAAGLYHDMEVIVDMAKHLPERSVRGAQAFHCANDVANQWRHDDRSTWSRCRELTQRFLQAEVPDARAATRHHISVQLHMHLDICWLWSYSETRRKSARSWATQCTLLEDSDRYGGDLLFVQSQAQLFAWLQEDYPDVFARVVRHVRAGRFVPVGGTWVEMDANVPAGESLVRQFLYGQRYFEEHFNVRSRTFWLPDTFGYAANLPQVCRLAGCENFVTQKLSWNMFNKMPSSTFWWSGLDGARVLTHFPPVDTYNAQMNVRETLASVENFKEHGRSNESMMQVGNGDGGGGATRQMLERYARMRNVNGLPSMQHRAPDDFFGLVRAEEAHEARLLTWSGELYFEMHAGVLTTQAAVKLRNRRCEQLLRDTELALVTSSSSSSSSIDYAADRRALERAWKLVLCNQFHDALPGSSIGLAYGEVHRYYDDVERTCAAVMQRALAALSSSSSSSPAVSVQFATAATLPPAAASTSTAIYNSLARPRVVLVGDGLLALPACGWAAVAGATPVAAAAEVRVTDDVGSAVIVLENAVLRVEVLRSSGQLRTVFDKRARRQVLAGDGTGGSGNRIVVHDDTSLFWAAWNVEYYHLEAMEVQTEFDVGVDAKRTSRTEACMTVRGRVGQASTLTQRILLRAEPADVVEFETDVDWHERDRFLKVEFAVAVQAERAYHEVAYGAVQRPTHANTSWDAAKFEACAHRYSSLCEYGYGVALLNDCKYGAAVHGNVMRLSLLRSPKRPDAFADMGLHRFRYALMPHRGSTPVDGGVLRRALEFNAPLYVFDTVAAAAGGAPSPGLGLAAGTAAFRVDETSAPSVVLDCVKFSVDEATDASRVFLLRLYEAGGGRVQGARVTVSRAIARCSHVTLLEEPFAADDALRPRVEPSLQPRADGGTDIVVDFERPFHIVTLRCEVA